MKAHAETEVLVVGAGPVGLFAAFSLARRNVRVAILEKQSAGSFRSYALALHPATLALFGEAGLAEDVLGLGRRLDTVALYVGASRVRDLRLSPAGGPFPFLLVLPQSVLEHVLHERLKAAGVEVLWNHQLMRLEREDDASVARIARMGKVSLGYPVAHTEWVIEKEYPSRAGFVIGADGYDSFVRRTLGVGFPELGPAEVFGVLEFRCGADLGDEVRLVLHDDTTSVLWPLRGGRGRWSLQIDPAAGRPSAESLLAMVRERAPWFEVDGLDVEWSTAAHFQRRLVDRIGEGRIWLAGDAAHVTGPAGVQSMNAGLCEANDLAERIAGVLREGAPLGTLQAYGRERHAQWQRLLGAAGPPRAREDAPDWAAQHAARLVPCLPALGEPLDDLLGQCGLDAAPESSAHEAGSWK